MFIVGVKKTEGGMVNAPSCAACGSFKGGSPPSSMDKPALIPQVPQKIKWMKLESISTLSRNR
jgi:hypothetical protein